MIVYFANHGMNILDLASNTTKNGLVIDNDVRMEEIDSGVATFEFDLRYTESTRNSAVSCAKAGNHVLTKDGNRYDYYQIIETELNTKEEYIHVYAEDAGLDLLNELTDSTYAENTAPHTIQTYISWLIYDTGFTLKLNEVDETVTKIVKISEGVTLISGIQTVLDAFDAELKFSFQIDRLTVKKKYINLYEKRGKKDVTNIYINSEVDNIIIKRSIENLATAYRVVGGTPKGADAPITLKGYAYDDQDFYVDNGWLFSRKALKEWSRYRYEEGLKNDVGHIVKNFTSNTTNQKTLFTRALASLKKYCKIRTTYEIDIALLPSNVHIGDTINIIDRKHDLYINARVLKLEVSKCNNSSTATLGEFKTKQNDISSKMQQLADQFEDLANKRQLYTWIAYADDNKGTNISLTSNDKKYMGIALNQTSKQTSDSLKTPSLFTWSRIQGTAGKDTVALKITSSNGTVLKNGKGTVVLSVTIQVGTTRITNITDLKKKLGNDAKLIWKYKAAGATSYTEMGANNKHISEDGFKVTVYAETIKKKTTFSCVLDY